MTTAYHCDPPSLVRLMDDKGAERTTDVPPLIVSPPARVMVSVFVRLIALLRSTIRIIEPGRMAEAAGSVHVLAAVKVTTGSISIYCGRIVKFTSPTPAKLLYF